VSNIRRFEKTKPISENKSERKRLFKKDLREKQRVRTVKKQSQTKPFLPPLTRGQGLDILCRE
jgi:hypothetical protein